MDLLLIFFFFASFFRRFPIKPIASMSTSTTGRLLSEYILEKLDLPELLSFDSFAAKFPPNTSKIFIKSIYDQLVLQQEQKLLAIKRTIENLLQQDVYANAGHCSNIDASKVEALNRSFTEVTKQLKQVCAKQAEEVEKELSHLDLTLEMLDEIEIPKVIDQEIQDAVSKCDKVTDLLDKI